METLFLRRFILISISVIGIFIYFESYSQCVNCYNCYSNSSYRSSAIGQNDTASGYYSFASGLYSRARNMNSIAMGYNNISSGDYSITLGGNLQAASNKSILIGYGYNNAPGSILVNNIPYSMMVGFSSIYPTLFISRSDEYNKTGKIGIGNVTNPLAKLHIKADADEEASILVAPNTWTGLSTAMVKIGNANHGIVGSYDFGLVFKTQRYYLFNEGNLGIGTITPSHLFHVAFSGSEFYLDNNTMTFESTGAGNNPAIKLMTYNRVDWKMQHNYANSALEFKFSNATQPSLYLNSDGSIGIGTSNTYGYKLAVSGKILTDEVMVLHIDQWYDHVFDTDYPLMDLGVLQSYIQNNKHLPGIPSKDEVKDNGIELARMNGLLLQKVEELTLYIIKQEERIKALEAKYHLESDQNYEK